MVSSMPQISLSVNACESCLTGKQTRNPFYSQLKMRSKECLEVVYFNICGPVEVPSLDGNRYFIAFVDEYNKMVWVY